MGTVKAYYFFHMSHEPISAVRKNRKLRVLIADDSLLTRTSLALSCSVLPDVEVVGFAKDGREALELVRQTRPDVLTLDMWMPKLNGVEVLERMQEEHIPCTVIVLTAIGEETCLKQCANLGAKYFYNKGKELEKVSTLLETFTRT